MLNPELQRDIAAKMHQYNVPAIAIAAVEEGTLAYTQSLGVKSRGSNAPVTPDTIFEAASLSKPLFAYAVLQFAASGGIDLDKPLAEYLDTPWELYVPRLSLINARHVLSHQSGLPNWRPMITGENGETIRGKLHVDFLPGEHFTYSGEGYEYLQFVIEHLTGQPLHQWLAETMLEPLGMTRSSYVWRENFAQDAAEGLHDDLIVTLRRHDKASSAYSLCSTAGDYARFLLKMLDPADAIAPNMLKAHSQLNAYPRLKWGLGWGIQQAHGDQPIYWQWGGNRGFQSFAAFWRAQQRGIVILTNSNHGLEAIQQILPLLDMGDDHAAFEWLLPPDRWRADGEIKNPPLTTD